MVNLHFEKLHWRKLKIKKLCFNTCPISPQRPKPKIIIYGTLTHGKICHATIAKICRIYKVNEMFYLHSGSFRNFFLLQNVKGIYDKVSA